MSKQSEYVKSWRKRSKARIIESMGGQCAICGYKKCVSALALHHLDPNSKDFNLSDALKNAKAWNKIVNELRKCVLLCHNCHCEVHEKLIILPEDALKFNEELFNYKFKNKICKICNNTFSNDNIFCSKECLTKSKFKINWDLVDLKEQIKTKSISEISKEIGVSYNTVLKRIKDINNAQNIKSF